MTDRAEQDIDDTDEDVQIEDVEAVDATVPEDVTGTGQDADHWSRAAGAIALGVIDPADQDEAEAALAAIPSLRDEVILLQPVANILRSLYQTGTATQTTAPIETPVPDSVPGEKVATETPAKPKRLRKPPPTQTNVGFSRAMPTIPWGKVIIGASAAIAVLAILWAFALLDKISSRDDEIAAQATEIANLHAAGNASAYLLYPTADGGTAAGTLYYSPANSAAVIDVVNLPSIESDQVFQVWFQQAGSTSWIPGPTFTANNAGQAVQRLAGDAPTFAQVAISVEPSPGSTDPSGPFIVTGTLAQANG